MDLGPTPVTDTTSLRVGTDAMEKPFPRIIWVVATILFTALLACFLWPPLSALAEGLSSSINSIHWSHGAVRIVVVVTLVLTLAGAMGGLAYHVARIGFQWPQIVIDKDSRRPRLDLGFVGDAFLGVVAANALHVPLAALVPYETLNGQGTDAKSWLTLVAFGILGGYAGGVLLKRLSDSLLITLAKEVKENKKLVREALDESESLREQKREEEDELLFRAVDEAATTQRELDLTTAYLLDRRVKEISKIRAQEGLDKLSAVDALFAAYAAYREHDLQDSVLLLEHSLKKDPSESYAWAVANLLGLSYHYQMDTSADAVWFTKAKLVYEKALEKRPGTIQSAILTINLGYLLLDHEDFDEALQKFDAARQESTYLKNKDSMVLDVALLGISIAYTLKYAKGKAASAPSVKEKEYRDQAVNALKEIERPDRLGYLIRDKSVPPGAISEWKRWGGEVPDAFQKIL